LADWVYEWFQSRRTWRTAQQMEAKRDRLA